MVIRFRKESKYIQFSSFSKFELTFVYDVHMRCWGIFFADHLASDTVSFLKAHDWLLDLGLSHWLHKRYVFKKVDQLFIVFLVNFE